MTHQKTGNSIGTTAPVGFVPRQNTQNSAKFVRKATFTLFMFFLFCAAYAQNISIVSPTGAYYCGSVVVLEVDATINLSNPVLWSSTGGVSLRQVGSTGSGNAFLGSSTSNRVEAIINGAGTVTASTLSGSDDITLTPSPATLNNVVFGTLDPFNTIQPPNGIQTTKGWICVSNDGSTETITLTNPSPLNIFWVVSGGAVKVSETQSSGTSPFTASVTIATSGAGAGKGFIRAFVSDPCGTLTCDPALDLEILKDLQPTEIAGPTCLRNNNLEYNANIGTVVYSITDEFAGNAIFDWELLQGGVPVTRTDFRIRSQVLYGNSATIEYEGILPSDIGNFSLRVTNACGGTFTRDITVSPATPNITPANNTYCISNAAGTTQTITLDPLLLGQEYVVTPQGSVNWNVVVSGNTFTVTFNDAISGAVEVEVVNETDASCGSATKLIYFNREGTSAATISGTNCIENGSTDAATFIADVFGQYTWSIAPALPSDYLISSAGNVLSITPPTTTGFGSGAITSRNYTITATLQGCASTQTATFDFEFAPVEPTIIGETCVTPGDTYQYDITSDGAATYIATVTTAGGTVNSPSTPIGTPFSYTATSEDATISVTTFSATGCASLPTEIDLRAQPIVNAITSTDLCVDFNETPTITYTADVTGTATSFDWTHPAQWTVVSGGGINDNSITLTLDNNTAGGICLRVSNNGCDSEELCLDVSRNALAVRLLRSEIPAGTFGNPFPILVVQATTVSGDPLTMRFFSGTQRTGLGSGSVIDDSGSEDIAIGTPFAAATTSTSAFYSVVMAPGQGINSLANPWLSLSIENTNTGCYRAVAEEIRLISTTAPGGLYKTATSGLKASFEINAYPNPVENILNVKVPNDVKVSQTYLVDTKGNIVFQSTDTSNTQKIDVSKFAKGMYFLGVLTDKGMQGKKIIIE